MGCLGTSTIAGATGGSGAANELETEAAENVTTPVEAYAMLPLKMLRVLPVEHGNLSSCQLRANLPTRRWSDGTHGKLSRGESVRT